MVIKLALEQSAIKMATSMKVMFKMVFEMERVVFFRPLIASGTKVPGYKAFYMDTLKSHARNGYLRDSFPKKTSFHWAN